MRLIDFRYKLKYVRSISKKVLLASGIYLLGLLILTSCESQKPIDEVQGEVQVLIPLETKDHSVQLKQVTLKNVTRLNEASGSYVRFYYMPGAKEGSLVGESPQAFFIRTSDNVFVPRDILTQQMFTLYYHIQNLNDFNSQISPELQQTVPFAVGLNTKVVGNSSNNLNNAFFDGQSQALLFVPYNLKQIPISVNAGIIAHEFFHSIFFKKVLGDFNSQQNILIQGTDGSSTHMKAFYVNQTYVRGVNEGLADYWGWVYTDNIDYISLSLPEFGESRKMQLDEGSIGKIETQADIEAKVEEAQAIARNPSEYLSGYIYKIGTPHARFMKELTIKLSRDGDIDLATAKLQVARVIYAYLKTLSVSTSVLSVDQVLSADNFFSYIAQPKLSGLQLTPDQCDFVLKYVKIEGKNKELNASFCKGTNE